MSAQASRPGGLTALAVINFVFGSLGTLGSLGLIFFFYVANYQPSLVDEMYQTRPNASQRRIQRVQQEREEMERVLETIREKPGLFAANTAISALTSILALASGFGMWRVRKFLGRVVGSAYAVVSLSGALLGSMLIPPDAPGGGFSALTILTMIYPFLVLVLLNTVFAEDFEDAALPDDELA